MHGISQESPKLVGGMVGKLFEWVRAHRRWCMFVVLPTVLLAGYYYLIAADQYESEAHFIVRSADRPQAASSGLSQALTMVGGASSSNNDSMLVADYLTSHDAVSALEKRVNLRAIFQSSNADLFSRLWGNNPAPETVLKYYRKRVDVKVSSEDGIATLRVRTFEPKASVAIINQLLALSEDRVNEMNRRNYNSAVSMAQRQVAEAEQNVASIQSRITSFRRDENDVSPAITGQARVTLVTQLQGQLAEARAQLSAASQSVRADAPQVVALRSRVTSLASQVAQEQARIANGPGNVATGLGQFESLKARQEFAAKSFDAASAALQQARNEAAKQQLFVVTLVAPNLPVKSLYPERGRIVITAFIALMLIYGISWLIAAGVREHSV